MAGNFQPLDQKFPISNPDGTPTDYFTRWAQQRMDDIVAAATADQVTTAIDDWAAGRLINTASPILGGGSLANDLNLSHAASGVAAGTYGDATNVAQITVNAKGHITDVVDVPIAGGSGTVTTTGTPAAGEIVIFSGPTSITNGDLSGDVSTSGTLVVTIGAHKVTRAMLTQTTGATLLGSTGAGNVADLTAAQAKTFLAITAADVSSLGYFATGTNAANLTGTVAAAQLPAMTGGDVTSPAGSTILTIGPATVTLAKMANLAANTLIGNNTGGAATPIALSPALVKALLAIAAGDVSGLTYFATGTNAANLTGIAPASTISDLSNASTDATLNISGGWVSTGPVGGGTTIVGVANRIQLHPWTPSRNITITDIGVIVTTALAASNAKVTVYSMDATTRGPGSLIHETGNLSCATTSYASEAFSYTFLKGVTYWIGVRTSSTQTLLAYFLAGVRPIGRNSSIASPGGSIVTTMTFANAATDPFPALTVGLISGLAVAAVSMTLA